MRLIGLLLLSGLFAGSATAQGWRDLTSTGAHATGGSHVTLIEVKASSQAAAMDIAKRHGMDKTESAELSDGVWEVKGTNKTGIKMEVLVSASDGRVLKTDYGHPSPHSSRQ